MLWGKRICYKGLCYFIQCVGACRFIFSARYCFVLRLGFTDKKIKSICFINIDDKMIVIPILMNHILLVFGDGTGTWYNKSERFLYLNTHKGWRSFLYYCIGSSFVFGQIAVVSPVRVFSWRFYTTAGGSRGMKYTCTHRKFICRSNKTQF